MGAWGCWGAPGPHHPVKPKTTENPKIAEVVKKISLKYPASQPYVFEGPFEIARRTGEDPKEVLGAGTIKLMGAPGRKYRLHLEHAGKASNADFDLISDGKTQWTYIPALNEYTEQAAQPAAPGAIVAGLAEKGVKPDPRAVIGTFSLQLVPMLAALSKVAEESFMTGAVLTVVSKKDQNANQDLLYLTINSDTLAISKLAWVKALPSKPDKMLVRLDLSFKEFRAGEPIADSQFTFAPPADAKLVASLPAEAPPEAAAEVAPANPAPK